ncbi:Sodium:sulfate symporter transmembrane region-domain-containing protein [Dipodascopsis tothii]|uniref:Sodium:sulfate symporter transmembrane region-domain-containing protein n=1 Tax=Dipodascopsis tothii TaxID=44089 RepID=UPI0034CFC508
MKFSESVQLNAVPEWSAQYIAYSELKKVIHDLESRHVAHKPDSENTLLISSAGDDLDATFREYLDSELGKISLFYGAREEEFTQDLARLEADLAASWAQLQEENTYGLDQMDEEAFSPGLDLRITLKKRAIHIYVALSELQSYVQLNLTGFGKALKKFDKLLMRNLQQTYLDDPVGVSYPFLDSTRQLLADKIDAVVRIYATVSTGGDAAAARTELRLHLREYVVWERSTVWREIIGMEKKALKMGLTNQGLLTKGEETVKLVPLRLRTPLGTLNLPRQIFNSTSLILAFVVAVFVTIVLLPIFDSPEQRNCLAILVAASMLWASEVIPLFVTSLLIPLLIVVFRTVRSPDDEMRRLSAPEATSFIFAAMWTPVIMLLLGGFAIAAALSKYNIAKVIATWVLSNAGTKPRNILLVTMFVALFLSMWISNVASPVLCLTIVQPLLKMQTPDSNFPKALLMGIALASNVGGMASPIASPQNIIALQNMRPAPSWGSWFFVALPVCVVSIVLIWALLLVTLNPAKGATTTKVRRSREHFNGKQIFVCVVTVVTIALWCVSHQLEGVFGDMGVLAIIPLVVFFGTGILSKEDFDNFMWTIIILAMGGIALGKSVSSSGLLESIAQGIRAMVSGMGVYGVMAVFGSMILVIATFISHTVAALILLPIVAEVGQAMPNAHPRLLVMGSAFLCSAAMGLPTSGFPNLTAICQTDEAGRPYLTVRLFITRGVPASLLAYTTVISLGYGLMKIVNL